MAHFRAALMGGAAVIVGLAAFGLFPVALVAAALLVPIVTLLYVYDVDVYGEEPARAMTYTVLWGIAAGVGVALLARGTLATGAAAISRDSAPHVVFDGLLIPALGAVLMLAGPLALLPYHRFDEVIDGASFAVVTAAVFNGAEAFVFGTKTLQHGLHPGGDALPWIWRVWSVSIGTPILAMGAIAFATSALWFRFRGDARDPRAMHAFGHPVVAVALAIGLIAGGAVLETLLPIGGWVAALAALDLLALWLLRRTLHVALLEQAADIDIAAPFTCANCGATTARHTFCGNCGVSLRAMPKVRSSPQAAALPEIGS